MHFKTLAVLALASNAIAQRPTDMSICDYYTTALLKENTAANQLTLLTLVVNTAVIGNYTKPNVGIVVPGILNPKGMYNDTPVNLVPYFNGGLKSSNRGGEAVSVNFLDGGGAAPLMKNMPAIDKTSNQYNLLMHLYQYFGTLLGCSMQDSMAFPSYGGQKSQGTVHRFMDLNPHQLGYFITQVGLSAASFGVAAADVTAVGMELEKVFGYRCSPPAAVIPAQGPQLQAICQAKACPMEPMSNNTVCAEYKSGDMPIVANATLAMGEGMNASSASGTGSMASGTSSMPAASSSGAAGHVTGQVAAVLGAAALAFAL